jgi:hypothetical protein
MNVLKKIAGIFFLLVCISSCQNKEADFNNALVNIQKSVLHKVQEFGKKMKQVSADSFPSTNIKPQTDSISLFIDGKIIEAENLPAPENGENLKAAILKQLAFEKDILAKIGRLALPDLSQEERTLIETEFLSSQDKANALEDSVKAAQEAFAENNNFTLQDK